MDNHVAKILPKLSRARYAVRAMHPFSSLNKCLTDNYLINEVTNIRFFGVRIR